MLQGPADGQKTRMPVLRALARPMAASIFIVGGFDTFRNPGRVAPAAEPVVAQLAERFSFVPAKPEQAVRLNGAVQMVAGSLLALGRFPRLSAAVLAATLVPTTAAGHRFWEAEDDATRRQQRTHFLKNCSLFGGLLIAAADTAGSPSLAWRSRHAATTARREASMVTKTAKTSGKAGAKTGVVAGKVSAKTGAAAGKVSAKTGAAAGKVSAKTGAAAGKASAKTGAAADKARSLVSR
jgi:putative oxidoreductase